MVHILGASTQKQLANVSIYTWTFSVDMQVSPWKINSFELVVSRDKYLLFHVMTLTPAPAPR